MLHIILAILKIVGILLAVLFLVVLLAVCSALFVPLRYQIAAEGGADGIRAEGSASWLLHIVSVKAAFQEGKLTGTFRILFFRKALISDGKNPEPKKKQKEKKAGKERKEKTENQKTAVETQIEVKKVSAEKVNIENKQKSIRKFLQSIPEKLRQIRENIQGTFQKAGEFLAFLKGDDVKAVVLRFRRHLVYLWRHLRPGVVRGNIRYGFEDPSLTGQLTGILYLLLPLRCYEVRLEPDFENVIYEGKILARGHIRICHIVKVGWQVFQDKEFRRILKRFQV